MRLLVLVLALVLLLLALLTLVKAPTLLGWKLALLAGEYGYILCLVAVVLLLTQLRGAIGETVGLSRALALSSVFTNAIAAALFAAPAWRACSIARELPQRWATSFGEKPEEKFFSWQDFLCIRSSPTVRPVTYTVPFDTGSNALDFYPAQKRLAGASPCVVVVHGGGWNNGDRTQLSALNSWLATRGFSVAAIDYRLVPSQWPAQREDTETALRWLQAHAQELHVDPQQLVLLGRSAGGQIALATAYGATKASWRGVISLYGPADLNFAYEFGDENDVLHSLGLMRALLGGTPEQMVHQYRDASPYSYVATDDPPTLLIHGQLDTLVWHKQSARLDQKLAQSGVPHLFISLPWATHAFDVNPNGPSGQLTRHAVEAFLHTVLSKKPASPLPAQKEQGPDQ